MSSRFAVAIHVLTFLARFPGPQTSEYIASSVRTNAVVIRRLMASLRAARLVKSQGGAGGGWELARAPEAVTLRDVFRAVEEPPLFRQHDPSAECPVGATIVASLDRHFEEALQGMEGALGRTTIADIAAETRRESSRKQRNL